MLMSIFGDVVRAAADVGTFGTNELAGNPAGKLADQLTNPTDPNAGSNALSQADWQAEYNLNAQNNAAQSALAQQNIQMQEDFAQNGISWRVADAAKNGISPLAALGAAEPGYSPVNEVLGDGPSTPSFQPSSPSLLTQAASAGVQELGQGLGRSLLASSTPIDKASAALDLAYKSKQNDLLGVQIALAKKNLMSQPGTPPGMPASMTVMNADGTASQAATYNTHSGLFGPVLWSVHNQMIPQLQDAVTNFDFAYPSSGASAWSPSDYSTGGR